MRERLKALDALAAHGGVERERRKNQRHGGHAEAKGHDADRRPHIGDGVGLRPILRGSGIETTRGDGVSPRDRGVK